jgi:hypothetical protein
LRPDGGAEEVSIAEVPRFVDERHNPENSKGVAAVEVFLPAPLLASGLCLVDTPGLGSVFGTNAAVTSRFLPQIDAALAVLGADPPITGEEAEFLGRVTREIGDRLLVALNKADRVSPAELRAAREFTLDVLQRRLHLRPDRIFEVSARERLETGAPTRDWNALVEHLGTLAKRSATSILGDAMVRVLRRSRQALLHEIAEQHAALRRPIEATEGRVAGLRRALAAAERSLGDLAGLFAATEVELARRFEQERRTFLAGAAPRTRDALGQAIRSAAPGAGRRLRDVALERARELVEREIRAFLADVEPVAESLYREATDRFVALANDFLVRTAGEGAQSIAPLRAEEGFREPRHFFFTNLMSRTAIGPLAWLGDVLGVGRLGRVMRHALAYAAEILDVNAMRVENDLRDRTLESRRSLEAQVRERLTKAVAVGERALAKARERQSAGAAAVAADLARLASLEAEVERLGRAPAATDIAASTKA